MISLIKASLLSILAFKASPLPSCFLISIMSFSGCTLSTKSMALVALTSILDMVLLVSIIIPLNSPICSLILENLSELAFLISLYDSIWAFILIISMSTFGFPELKLTSFFSWSSVAASASAVAIPSDIISSLLFFFFPNKPNSSPLFCFITLNFNLLPQHQ